MKRIKITSLFILSLVWLCACDTANNVESVYKQYFIKTFGSNGDQEGVDILVNDDNTITLLGNSIHPNGEKKIYFIKTDLKGKILIEKELGDLNEDAKDIEAIPGGYVILSNIFVSENQYDIKLLRTDLNGEVNDSIVFSGLADQYGYSVTPLSDNGFFVVGNTRDVDFLKNATLPPASVTGKEDTEDPLIIRFDNTLFATDTFRIGGSYKGSGVKIYESGSAYTFAGYSDELSGNVDGTFNTNFVFRTFATEARGINTEYVGDRLAEEKMSSFIKMPNGTFFGIGTEISGSGLEKIFISKIENHTDNVGNVVPHERYSTSIGTSTLEGVSGYPSSNGAAVYVLADEYQLGDPTSDIRLLKINAFTGELMWSQKFGSKGQYETAKATAELPNGDLMIVGTANLINQNKLILIKVNSRGEF